ncbi:hypothetical protein [Chelativorans salis]|uniref:Uncharacterized protein n=1 Tax=Chelativorans salis TaxID=2978478 RepID=A0ABT2LJS5_9HYPH|nr:hypothetical protein [Chelativorans sp. EGI FJ00035]MCT7374857.1 hypothetical protein [Chelativorans sp. EGI FJ00035]
MATSGKAEIGIFDAEELAEIRTAVEAVCAELGIGRDDTKGREEVASRMMRSWVLGRRTPLGLVNAGLDAA